MGNQQGKERRDYGRRIDWKNAERPSPPGKPYLVPEEGSRPTDVIIIRWSPPVTDGGAPIVGYLVEHRRTGSPHWLRATPDLIQGTELPLTGLEPGWRYQFRVSAENDIGRSEPGDLSEPFTVTPQKWAACAPFFNVEIQDTIGLENEKVEFKVQVMGIPPPTIAWYKDGFEVFSSRRTKIINENDQSTFIIHQAALEDEGEIKCTATNRAGHAVTKGMLKLEAPPRIRLPRQYEDGLIFEKGELIKLKVTTAGRPKPEVFWYHNGELLQKSERVELAISEAGSMVKISDACREDRGEYTIKGLNKIGEDSASFLVTVTDRPSPPGKVQITTFGRMVTLSWSSPEDDGGCKIGSYIVEYFRVRCRTIGWDMWLKAKNSRQLSTILEDLIEGSEYKFRVRAENPYGVSEPSEESDVVFIPDPKRGIFKPTPRKESDLVKDYKRHEDNESSKEESEESRRRQLLEEKARRLLDTPLNILLPYEKGEQKHKADILVESMKDETLPPPVPKRRKRLTPSPVDVNLGRQTPSPIEKKKLNSSVETTNVYEHSLKEMNGMTRWNQKKDEEMEDFKFKEEDSFGGPMTPRENDDSIMHGSSELLLVIYPRDRSKSVELSAQQRSEIALNLSGVGVAPPMSLSAPELGGSEIVELPLMRDAVSSSELLYERTAARLYQDRIDEEAQRVVKRRYSADRKSVERRASLKEQLERRLSFKGEQEDIQSIKQIQPTKQLEESRIPKPVAGNTRTRLSSVERERLEFAMVRERLKKKEEAQKLGVVNHDCETSTTTATSSSVDPEDLEEEYEDDEESYLDSDKKEEEVEDDYDDEIYKMKNKLSKIPVTDTSLSLPKPIRIAPLVEQEIDTYHPRSMIPTRSVMSKLPVEEVKTSLEPPTTPSEVVRPEPVKTKIPVSSKTKRTTKLLKKFGLKKDKKVPEVTLTPADPDSPPAILPKPILKNKILDKKKGSPKALLKLGLYKPTDKSISEEESESESVGKKKKQVRIAEPSEEAQQKKDEKPIDQNARENQVLIFHYSDIVKEFGTNKKPPAKLYLNYEELKAHAKEPEKVNSVVNQNKINPGELSKMENAKPDVPEFKASTATLKSETPQRATHKSLEYLTDVVMFVFACWLYLFKNELYAIPVLCVMGYRQLKDMTMEKYVKYKNSVMKFFPGKWTGELENARNQS